MSADVFGKVTLLDTAAGDCSITNDEDEEKGKTMMNGLSALMKPES